MFAAFAAFAALPADDIVASTGNHNVLIRQLDLLSLASVRAFVEGVLQSESQLDVLVNNAGAGGLPNEHTADGLTMGMQANHFGPFLLTCLLMGKPKKNVPVCGQKHPLSVREHPTRTPDTILGLSLAFKRLFSANQSKLWVAP